MTAAFDRLADVAVEAARAALPEQVSIGSITTLPRGADAFVGTERPLLLACTRWLSAAPGGVLLGGSPAGLAAALGFGVPEKPVPVPPEERKPDDPPPPRWSDLVSDAAREPLTNVTQAIAEAVATAGDIPPDCATTQVSMNETDAAVRAETGTIPDAVVLLLHTGEHELRLVVVVPGIVVAHLTESAPADPAEDPAGTEGAAPDSPVPARVLSAALGRGLSKVPLELSIEMGRARVPLAHVLQLQEGEVLELEQSTDAPVDLVSGDAPVAHGDLEVSEHGNLVLHVTAIPGREAVLPSVVDEAEGAVAPVEAMPTPDLPPTDDEPAEAPAPEAAAGTPDDAAEPPGGSPPAGG